MREQVLLEQKVRCEGRSSGVEAPSTFAEGYGVEARLQAELSACTANQALTRHHRLSMSLNLKRPLRVRQRTEYLEVALSICTSACQIGTWAPGAAMPGFTILCNSDI